ncbi:MAG: OsmC family protein [candidate division Zixibacteria bacterium]|nr:OsmC family protein [candidate division Zixibacteria bacterium]NIR67597.1 OsmC family protein [candidate division Zixibacteria bacterium]NIS16328.1 OsmC family protein [candidate division Zixibacteria bacterium]NIS48858.1 OsmC family protein [candidate division Zixibacteria bacterium]NIT52706.1 OsmC family protein [candidate division Zixibacteria bacterium]
MPVRNANAVWEGTLKEGKGKMKLGTGAYIGSYSAGSRFADDIGTNPEELIGAAHAGCFSMALAKLLEDAGFQPEKIDTVAKVTLEKQDQGFKIISSELTTEGDVLDIDNDKFAELAEKAKENCPVSQALAGVKISLNAKLIG